MTDDINRAIGRLEAGLGALAEHTKEYADRSDAGRSRVYKELEASRLDIAAIKAAQEAQKESIEASSKLIAGHAETLAQLERWRERFIGMAMLASLLSGAVIAAVTYGAQWVARKLGLV